MQTVGKAETATIKNLKVSSKIEYIMKKNLSFVFNVTTLLIGCNNALSQDVLITPTISNGCGYSLINPTHNLNNPINTNTYRSPPSSAIQYVFNIKIHFIANNVPVIEQENKAIDIVASLNLAFNQANIFFKFKGFDNISDSSFLTINGLNINSLYPEDTENIEIFIPNVVLSSTTFGATQAWVSNINNQVSRKIILIRKDRIPTVNLTNQTNSSQNEYTLVHEMGHYLGLYHTHQLWSYHVPTNTYNPVNDFSCALEENLDNSQWNYLGDLIQDTNPDRTDKYWSIFQNNEIIYVPKNNPDCSVNINGYHNDATCNTSINFSQFNPPISNIMSYYRTCRTSFTPNQYTYMRNYINLHLSNDNGTNGFLMNKMNTIESLYQPMTGGYNTQGISNLNYINPQTPVFQKGFDYKFVGCDFQLPKVMSSYTVNQTPIGHPYYQAIKIMQIDPNNAINCYIPPQSAYISGEIISFDSVLYNGNTTIQTLDSEEIINTNLINNLPTGHHIIKKNLNDGQTINQNIIKQ